METKIKTRATIVAVVFFMMADIFSAKAQLLYKDNHLFVGPRPANYNSVASAASPGVYIGPKQGIEYWNGGLNFWTPNQGSSNNYKLFVGDNGNVGIGRKPSTYKLEVNGQVWTSAGLLITSDETKKRNIKNMKKQRSVYVNKVRQLNGKMYDKLVESEKDNAAEIAKMVETGKISPQNASFALAELNKVKKDKYIREYGFIAQEVKKLFPELVDENEEGLLSINYTGLIPVLVEAIKDLQERVEKLEQANSGILLKRGVSSDYSDNRVGDIIDGNEYLSQNVPNPVDGSTVIGYQLPEGARQASIVVYSTGGAVVKKIPLDASGKSGNITLHASDLAKGINFYRLTVNGAVLSSKKLINP